MSKKIVSEDQWRATLPSEVYRICREKGTEPPFTGALLNNKEKGVYLCRCCDTPLFESSAKFDSGSGWPSFDAPQNSQCVAQEFDESHGMRRTEILCDACGCHLGHIFPDGPTQTGLRFCVNSASLSFERSTP